MPHVCHFPGCGYSKLKHLKVDQSKPCENDWKIQISKEFPQWNFTGKVLNICHCHFYEEN